MSNVLVYKRVGEPITAKGTRSKVFPYNKHEEASNGQHRSSANQETNSSPYRGQASYYANRKRKEVRATRGRLALRRTFLHLRRIAETLRSRGVSLRRSFTMCRGKVRLLGCYGRDVSGIRGGILILGKRKGLSRFWEGTYKRGDSYEEHFGGVSTKEGELSRGDRQISRLRYPNK